MRVVHNKNKVYIETKNYNNKSMTERKHKTGTDKHDAKKAKK